MRIKTMFIILVTVLITIVLVQNSDQDYFKFLWMKFLVSKLIMMALIALVAFILGIMVGKPTRVKKLSSAYEEDEEVKTKPGTLSDEDREYIN